MWYKSASIKVLIIHETTKSRTLSIGHRNERGDKKSSTTKIFFARYLLRVRHSACTNARGWHAVHIPPARDFKFCAIRIHFERGQAVIYACRACSLGPWRGNNSRVKEVGDGGRERERERDGETEVEKRGTLQWKKA